MAAKRFLDVLASSLGLLVLSPLYLLVAILIKRDSPGPAFYRGLRTGRGGRNFKMLKFRTMCEDPKSYRGPSITAEDDPRLTPLGRWLRDTKLNELPQLWNVLKGEMSLVGPRPEIPEIVSTWPAEVRQQILSLRPGITSPASVLYRREEKMLNGRDVMDVYLKTILPDKLRLDLLYVQNHSFLTDLDVILWTLIVLLPSVGQRPVPEARLYAGPLTSFARRYISWFIFDGMISFLAIGVVGLIWRMSGPLDLGVGISLGLAIVIALLFALINSMLGLKRVSWRSASPAYVFDLAFSSGLATAVVLLIDWFWPSGRFFPPGMIIETGLFAFSGFVAVRYRQRLITGFASRWLYYRRRVSTLGERVLIVGAGECGQLAVWLLHKSNLPTGFSVMGMVDDDPFKQNLRIDGYTVIGTTREIPALVGRQNIGVILYAISKIDSRDRDRILTLCRSLPVRLVIIPDLLKILQENLLPSVSQEQPLQPIEKETHDVPVV